MRDAFITYSFRTGYYTIALRESQVIKRTNVTTIHTEIGLIVSNWIHKDGEFA